MISSFESQQEQQGYKIEQQRYEYRPIDQSGRQYGFLKEFGTERGKLVGQVSTELDQQCEVGSIGFEFFKDLVEIGPAGRNLFVLESHRGKGLGKILTEIVIQWVKDVAKKKDVKLKSLKIKTNPQNTAAIKTAESLGFKEILKSDSVVIYELSV